MKNKVLAVSLVLVIGYALSWVCTVGIVKLITMCFSIGFSLPVATGIWLVLYIHDFSKHG